ncbi:molecular chaperone HtpG [Wolbachia endosymbiont of Litomosoides sigmodontis]|uniref:molecular chaperone HtpG n=1 Tax=Wolbachia endosymbiont of Litomosoides sigmodontis TaxID=80850 RepID=UPI001589683E|nr:molecular chaperone HtpG [Wolbachia endosymbiont of Litomosoides sigmodontis]QKX03027.1 molecular chaperone HtpG [Wolbachia endosymbiont of Litomosoides sigmodontis]
MHNIKGTENLKFDAEVGKVLNIVIHSLYTNKDIFLRELVSNASDACDKLRYESQLNPNLLDSSSKLKITISSNKDENELYIIDNGIGMNRQDLIDNLGTIASSGTQKFLDAIKNSKDSSQTLELIGKFGVGFYSSFMVASEVIVESRKAGEEESWVWRSTGNGEYSISKLDHQISCGTKITLVIRPEENEFLDKFRIENIVTTYSDHINFPVEFIDEEGKCEKLNNKPAIWTKPKNDITQEEHNNFFRGVAHVGGEPWMILHNKNEGAIEYINLLYVPSIKPFDLFHPDRRCSVKLYVNKVFITEDNVQIIPQYLRFLKGVVDSPDLPLNISRETLQNNRVVEQIRKSLTKRVISELSKKAKENLEEYTKFWINFGAVLKEGLCEAMPTDEREALLSICRFYSTDDEKLVSIDDYISRMKPEQEYVYYLTGNSLDSVKNSPQLEGFITKGLEVLLFVDPVDDFWTSVIYEYKGQKFKSVTRSDVDLEKFSSGKKDEENKSDEERAEENTDSIVQYFTKVLGNTVKSVKISKKLTDSPVCLAVDEGAMDLRMERLLREQKQLNYRTPKVFEINTKHPVIKSIIKSYTESGENQTLEDMVHLLFYQACIMEGEEMDDASLFAKKLNNLLGKVII